MEHIADPRLARAVPARLGGVARPGRPRREGRLLRARRRARGRVAAGVGGQATSRQGALHDLAGTAFGKFVIILLIIGFVAYAAWRVLQAVTVRESDEKKAWGKRIAYLARAAVYCSLAFSAGRIVAGAGGGQSQNQKAHKTTAVVLSWPGGTWLVGIAGAVLIGVGLWNLYRGLSRKFEDKWRGGMSSSAKQWGGRAGVVGHVARFVVFALIGVFAIKAASDYNPQDAVGLDGALQKLAHQSYGSYLLGLTAAGSSRTRSTASSTRVTATCTQ